VKTFAEAVIPERSAFDPGCVKTPCCCYDSPVILWGN
jgi:hypothetical protein